MRVVIPGPQPLVFERPRRVLRAQTAHEVRPALDEAQAALDSGAYIAGYLSYELGAAFSSRPTRSGRTLPLLALGIYDAPASLAQPPRAAYRVGPLRDRMGREAYSAALTDIARSIYDGDVYQVNFTVPFDFSFDGDFATLFFDLVASSGVAHAAMVEDGNHVLLSISPELFLEIDGALIRTKPMKGTAPLDRAGDLQTPKNRAEHVMIVDLLRNDLQRICSTVDVRELYEVERYPTLATMTSTIEGRLLPGMSLYDIFSATFPCGSITGAPKRSAMEIIEKLEPNPRDVYTGSLGFAGPGGQARWNVAIRTLQLNLAAKAGRLDVGGGIVADSSAQSEWDEIILKRAFFEPFVREMALLETFAADAPPARIAKHLARLAASAKTFDIPYDATDLRGRLQSAPPDTIARLRLDFAHVSVRYEAAVRPHEPVRLRKSGERTRSDDPMLQHKTSTRDVYDRGLREAAAANCFDTIYFNERGELTEGARSNLFVEVEGALYTPPLHCGVLPGILRAELLEQGRCNERVLYEADLETADAVFAGNSARGLLRAQIVKD